MIERIHVDAADPAVREKRVPALPDRGGAKSQRVEPAGAVRAEQHPVGIGIHTAFEQRWKQQRRAAEAGFERVKVLPEPFTEAGKETLPVAVDAEMQSQHVGGLRIHRQPPGGSEELVQNCPPHPHGGFPGSGRGQE